MQNANLKSISIIFPSITSLQEQSVFSDYYARRAAADVPTVKPHQKSVFSCLYQAFIPKNPDWNEKARSV